MNRDLQKYLALKTALISEKSKLEARLAAISKVLGQDVSGAASSPEASAPAPATTASGRRTFSAATKAKMAAAQKARWAKKKGVVESTVAPASTKKAKRTMSEATKAKMRAAHQARWAKKKGTAVTTKAVAATASTSAPAPKKRRKMSAAGKANIIAAVKARWAKLKALKKNQ